MSNNTRDFEWSFLQGGGELGALMRAYDWAATDLGDPTDWRPSLRTAVRLLLSSGHPMHVCWGESLLCLYNDAYRQSIGPERHPGSLGRPAREVWNDVWGIVGPKFEQVMSGRDVSWHENQLVSVTRNGVLEDVYWTYSYSPIDDDEAPNGVGGVLVICTETAAQSVNARLLAEADERLQLAIAASNSIGTWDWDIVNDRVFADSRFSVIYGVDPERAKAGAPIAEFFKGVPEEDLQALRTSIDHALRTGAPYSAEYRLIQPDGSVRWVVAQGRCLMSEDGRPVRFPGVSFDITARKKAEEDLRRLNQTLEERVAERTAQIASNETKLRSILETSHQYQGMLNLEGAVLYANATALRGIDAAPEDVFGKLFWETPWFTSTPGMPDAVRQAHSRVAHGETVRLEMRLLLPAGWRWFDFAMRPICDENRAVVAIVPEAIDVTDHRQAEEALRQSQKMEAVGQLTGGIAHDFNNMLQGISGNLELLQGRVAQGRLDGVQRYIDRAHDSAKRASALTQRLLAFSRRQTLSPKPIDVNRMVTGMEDLIRHSVGPDIHTKISLGDEVWPTLVDPSQLENTVLNLCINARDAMPDGGSITITTATHSFDKNAAAEHEVPPGDYVSLRVVDTGAGMTPEIIERAFDPFFTTKPLGQGTGLGLSMIYGFARQSGGQIRLASEVGHGTTVSLYLPRYIGEVEREIVHSIDPNAAPVGQGETVLVVDDEAIIRMLIAEVLESAGYASVEAVDGATALKVLQSDARIDLLVTDVGLPGGINGRQVADAGRATRPDLKVLFITGYAEKAVIRDGNLESGMQILSKPFSTEHLARKIKEMIQSR